MHRFEGRRRNEIEEAQLKISKRETGVLCALTKRTALVFLSALDNKLTKFFNFPE